ncbi:MAG: hypothetical protein WA431_01280 [Candidatus Cybelea sp.]
MNFIRTKSAAYALSAFVAAALLAACSSGGTQPASPSSGVGMNSSASHVGMNPSASHIRGMLGLALRARYQHHPAGHLKTWISPNVQDAPRLLFAGDAGTGEVRILRMPDMAERGRITGLETPLGECGDSNGNIYIADETAGNVYKYSRAGLELEVFNDGAYGFPEGCAVNPTNGAVAIANAFGPTGGQGNVAVFSSPSGPVTILQNPDQFYYTFVGYDPGGVLWATGYTDTFSYILSGCGASSCSTIPISGGTIHEAGAVQWDRVRGEWLVFDPQCDGQDSACSYPVSGSGALGSATTYLTDEGTLVCDMVQGIVAADHGNRYAAGGNLDDCGGSKSEFNRWGYPAGGVPTNHTLPDLGFVEPSGAAISNKNK